MGDVQRADEKPAEPVVESNPKDAGQGRLDSPAQESGLKFQHVVIVLADGRRGVFVGPELIKEIEMKLGVTPALVSVDFDVPRPIPRPAPEEATSGDTKADEKPAAGLEQKA